jgi:hypothetical protein
LGRDRPLRGGSLKSLGYRGITSRATAREVSTSTSHTRSCTPLLFTPLHLELFGPPLELFLGLGFFVLRCDDELILGTLVQGI